MIMNPKQFLLPTWSNHAVVAVAGVRHWLPNKSFSVCEVRLKNQFNLFLLLVAKRLIYFSSDPTNIIAH